MICYGYTKQILKLRKVPSRVKQNILLHMQISITTELLIKKQWNKISNYIYFNAVMIFNHILNTLLTVINCISKDVFNMHYMQKQIILKRICIIWTFNNFSLRNLPNFEYCLRDHYKLVTKLVIMWWPYYTVLFAYY